jgi:peptidyl-prolyl cis-trans isomerase C
MRSTAFAIALLLAATGPALAQEAKKGAEGAKPPQPEKVILATVNGTDITLSQFYEAVEALPPTQQYVALQNRPEFLDSLVKRELVYQDARERQLESKPEVASLLAKLQKEVLIQALLRVVIQKAQVVDDAEAERFYMDNEERFKTPEQITASHIVLKSEDEAKTTLADLKKGKDFAALAKERSIGPRASQGGYLGTISRGEMPSEFDQVAFTLPVGALSDVVKTPFGHHIIKVTENSPPKQLGFKEVSGQIQKQLQAQRHQETVRTFLEELSKKASVEVHAERLTNAAP